MSDNTRIKRVDLKVGFQCNNHCLFCVQGRKRERTASKKIEEIKKFIRESAKSGKDEIVLTGGEPTLHPDFLKIVRFAKKNNFSNIQIQTNGRMFAYPDFCVQTIKAGANEFAPALHGSDSKTHDQLTGFEGSFGQTVQGIKNLRGLGQRVITNTVVTKLNYRQLPQIAELLVKLDVNQFQFAFVHITGQAAENKKIIVPRKKEALPYVKAALDIGMRARKMVMTEAIPYCLMSNYEECIAEKIIPGASVFDIEFTISDYDNYRKTIGKAKGPECRRCKKFDICEGPWKEYPEMFGWSEFRPIE
ncbi:MAG: radical SAM protein [Patescibacteria group bacterium]|nr:radical SAM protein [Patescibacteria group bacterium]